jgi:hypothetical protein
VVLKFWPWGHVESAMDRVRGGPLAPVVEVAHIQRRGEDACPAQARFAQGCEVKSVGGGCHLGPTALSDCCLCGESEVCNRRILRR